MRLPSWATLLPLVAAVASCGGVPLAMRRAEEVRSEVVGLSATALDACLPAQSGSRRGDEWVYHILTRAESRDPRGGGPNPTWYEGDPLKPEYSVVECTFSFVVRAERVVGVEVEGTLDGLHWDDGCLLYLGRRCIGDRYRTVRAPY